jgi:hypothetical protein
MVNFGGSPGDKTKYTSVADEMWFEFPVKEAQIPDSPELMRQLSGRQYNYDKKDRKIIESKDEYKKRLGRSPDDADALILCYYNKKNISISEDLRRQLQERRKRA